MIGEIPLEMRAAFCAVVCLGMIFGDDGLIFVTDPESLIWWIIWWSGWALAAIFFAVFMMGGGIQLSRAKAGEELDG